MEIKLFVPTNFYQLINILTCILFRLMLLGGCSGFLKNMKSNHIKPDIKTFTKLLEVIPPTLIAEKVNYFIYYYSSRRILSKL